MPDPGRSRQESLLSGFQGSSLRVVRLEKDRTIAHSVERARGERPNPTHVYWKPSSFRCSLQSTGIWSVSRINFLAVSWGGFLPLTMAVMMSGASEGSRKRLPLRASRGDGVPLGQELVLIRVCFRDEERARFIGIS